MQSEPNLTQSEFLIKKMDCPADEDYRMKQTSYGFSKTVDMGFHEAIEKVTTEL